MELKKMVILAHLAFKSWQNAAAFLFRNEEKGNNFKRNDSPLFSIPEEVKQRQPFRNVFHSLPGNIFNLFIFP